MTEPALRELEEEPHAEEDERRHGGTMKNPRSVSTFALGRSTRYAPSTAAIAPLAPRFGMLAASVLTVGSVTNVCPAVATSPPPT